MRNGEVVLLSDKDVMKTGITIKETVKIVEEAFKAHGEGKVVLPPKPTLYIREHDIINAMPAYVKTIPIAGIKWVSVFPQNPTNHRLPTVLGTIILNDPETSIPLAIMDGTLITAMRTASTVAVGAKYLRRDDARTVGIIGAGVQARFVLKALNEVMKIERVAVASRTKESAIRYSKELSDPLGIPIEPYESTRELVKAADVIVTATAGVKAPIVLNQDFTSGKFGATMEGEPVWDPTIAKTVDKFVVDSTDQCKHGGQFYPIVRKSLVHIYGELGEIVANRKVGREKPHERILFWTRGVGFVDVAVASWVYKKALEQNLGQKFKLMDLKN